MIRITAALLAAMGPKEDPRLMSPLAAAMNEFFPRYDITTEKRVEHFLAQACHETDDWHTLTEYASGDAYDTRTDLGNTKARDGDGRLYKGRGIFQTTGKTNYKAAGDAMGLDLVKQPQLLAQPRNAVWAACIYWDSRKLNALADADDIRAITRKINGGLNGIDARTKYLTKARALVKTTDANGDRIGPGSSSDLVRSVQRALADKNYSAGRVDGQWGKMTRDAVMSLKADNGLDVSDPSITIAEIAAAAPRKLETREDTTVADLRADGSEVVKSADKVQLAGATVGGLSALGGGASYLDQAEQASGIVSRVKSIAEPFADFVPWISAHLWMILPVFGCAAIYFGYRVKMKRLEDHKIGKVQ